MDNEITFRFTDKGKGIVESISQWKGMTEREYLKDAMWKVVEADRKRRDKQNWVALKRIVAERRERESTQPHNM